MYLHFITLVFSLALGPDVKLLEAQETAAVLTSLPNEQSTVSSQVTEWSTGTHTEAEETTVRDKDPTLGSLTTKVETVNQTSEESRMTSELLTTPEPTTIPASTIITAYELSTSAAPPEYMSQPKQEEEETSVTNSTTTEPPQTPSPSPTIPESPALSTLQPVSPPVSYKETMDTSPTTTPTPTPPTLPPPTTTIIITTPTPTPTTTFTQEQTTLESDSSTHTEEMMSTTNSSTGINGAGSRMNTEDSKKGANWLIIAVIALVIFCILMTLCVTAIIIKYRKNRGKQHFGHTNGQRSKKKYAEDDVWAGPVKLGGVDGEGPGEGDALGQEKKTDEVEVTGLSTFVTAEENGGVGRPGSAEVEKWEEKEPLLYIDEEGKEKGTEAGKSKDADAKEGAGKTDTKEAEPNGGETFCLTTAV